MARRNYIFDTIKQAFKLFGYKQIETPAMENLSTLMGKYGEEGDKLLFKILNSGDCLKSISNEEIEERNVPHLASKMCEKGLRYDLTVPFARFVVQHRNDLQMPFKRFQIQPAILSILSIATVISTILSDAPSVSAIPLSILRLFTLIAIFIPRLAKTVSISDSNSISLFRESEPTT